MAKDGLITSEFRNMAVSFPIRVDAMLANLDTEEKAKPELDKAVALQEYVKRLKASIEIERPVALGVLKLKGHVGQLAERHQGKELPKPALGSLTAPTLAAYRKIGDHIGELNTWYEQIEDVPTQTEFLRHLSQTAEPKHRAKRRAAKAESVTEAGYEWKFLLGDCRKLPFADDTFDLVFCSPPYESQRVYEEVEFDLSGEEWVSWAVECFTECLRVCKGLVAWVVEGSTEQYAYSSTPFLLMADLHRRGVKVRKPCVYKRNGIPGTGGPDWLRNDWEPVICGTKNGKLPWSDNTAMGSPPKQNKPRTATNRNKNGKRKSAMYIDPDVCNPGNIISGNVGMGAMGWADCHQNEAPFPEWLAEFFVKSFCPAGGTVLDPFSGSGTTVSVSVRNGRNGVGVDIRESQVWLAETRLQGLTVKERESGQGLLL